MRSGERAQVRITAFHEDEVVAVLASAVGGRWSGTAGGGGGRAEKRAAEDMVGNGGAT